MLKRWLKKIILHIKMWDADQTARYLGIYNHMILPPSFYLSHSPEEVEEAMAAAVKEIREILKDMPD